MWHRILAIPTLWCFVLAAIGAVMAIAAHLRTAFSRHEVVHLNLFGQMPAPAANLKKVYWMSLSWTGAGIFTIAFLVLLLKFIAPLL
jgi:hypothetical protein